MAGYAAPRLPGVAAGPTWRPCDDVAADVAGPAAARARVSYQCTTIKVPQDWAAAKASPGASPSGPTFDIAVIRARSNRQHDRIGSLLVNPGGPGGSGIDLAVYLSVGPALGRLPADVLERFDIHHRGRNPDSLAGVRRVTGEDGLPYGFRDIRPNTALPARAPNPPGPDRTATRLTQPPNRPRNDVGKTVKRDLSTTAHKRRTGQNQAWMSPTIR